MSERRCPLCHAAPAEPLLDDGRRAYSRCPVCALLFMHAEHRPTMLAEVLRYQEHRNDAADEGYVRFQRRLADPLLHRLAPGARGLDFGCGPAPALAEFMSAAGRPTDAYDPLFRPDEALLARRYDFVACAEVIEHAHDPAATFERLGALLLPGGLLGVMTRFYGLEAPFARWWYRRDPTHVCFFSEPTMRWVATRHAWDVEFPAPHVAIFRVPGCGAPQASEAGSK